MRQQWFYSLIRCCSCGRGGGRTGVSLASQILILTLFLLIRTPVLDSCEHGAPISGPTECVTFTPEDLTDVITTYRNSQNSKQFYRYLRLHKDVLLVGAKNALLTLDKNDISHKIHEFPDGPRGDGYQLNCVGWGVKVDPDCQNHIRYITVNESLQYPSGDVVYVCGTGGYSPTGYLYNITSNQRVESFPVTQGNAKAKCPYDPFDNTTAIYVARGNPQNRPALYSAANADYTKSSPMIYRSRLFYDNGTEAFEYLQTARKDANWLNEPQFVGSFEMEDVVYFFFREESLEHSSCGKKVYSRVARVCKNDKGGPSVVKNQWTSFQKARLNCSIPGKVQYYFDEIQDIRLDKKTNISYGLFTTSTYGVTGSAICAFTRESIEAAFSGPYSKMVDGRWMAVPQIEEPTPRPGNCAGIPDSRQLPNTFLSFIKEKTLMFDAVQHSFGQPLFFKPSVLLQKLEAHFDDTFNVFFAGSNEGQVYQIYQPTSNLSETLISAVMSPIKNSGPVWSFQYNRKDKMLYVGYDSAIVQLELEKLCSRYDKADSCVFNSFCCWCNNTGSCMNKSSSQDSVTYCMLAGSVRKGGSKSTKDIWKDLLKISFDAKNPVIKYTNGLVTLTIQMPLCLRTPVQWYHGVDCSDLAKVQKNDEYLFGSDNSLTIRHAEVTDGGCYAAKDDKDQELAYYNVTVQRNKTELEDLWTRKFYEWCGEFEDYKMRTNIWKQTCGEPSNKITTVPQN